MQILTLENATKEELEGTYFHGLNSIFNSLKEKGLKPLPWIEEQNPPLKTALVITKGFIDFRKIENVTDDPNYISFDEKVKTTLPDSLIFQTDSFDWVGRTAQLHQVKDDYAYYIICEGSSSKIYNIYVPDMEKNIGKTYFLSKKDLMNYVIRKHEDAINFIESQRR